jgi:hypothetical protein
MAFGLTHSAKVSASRRGRPLAVRRTAGADCRRMARYRSAGEGAACTRTGLSMPECSAPEAEASAPLQRPTVAAREQRIPTAIARPG